jgi:PAS domain-containing protein
MPDPLPLIVLLARNLVEVLDTPAILTSQGGEWIFYNEAAGEIIGRRFEEYGRQSLEHWTAEGPLDDDGEVIEDGEFPLICALRDGVPSQGRFRIVDDHGDKMRVVLSALPLQDVDGGHGAIVLFWRSSLLEDLSG